MGEILEWKDSNSKPLTQHMNIARAKKSIEILINILD